jgi:sn-glycerol 3-phosphate transport system substrate-binding protein
LQRKPEHHPANNLSMSSHLFAGFLILFLSACAVVPPPSAPPAAPTNVAPVTISFWHTQTGSAAALLNALTDDFQKAYPTISLRGEAKNGESDLLQRGIAAMALNELPDFVIASHRTLGAFARKDALVPLDAFLNDPAIGLREDDRADFFAGLLDAGRFPELKNQLYAFPFAEHAVVLYYNADLLKAAKAESPPRTWDAFGTAARVTTKSNVRGWAMSPDATVFCGLLFSRGGSALNDTQTQARFNDDAGMKTLQLIVALSKGGSAYLADNADAARADFAQGKTALLFGTTNDLPVLSDAIARTGNNFQWGVTSVPQNDPARPVAAIFGANLAIFKTTPEKARAAWLFARWLAAPEQTARWSRATLSIPLRASALPLIASGAPSPLLLRLRDSFGAALPAGRAVPAVKDAVQVDAAIVELWTAVANGADVNAAMSRAVMRVNRILEP